MIDNEFEIPGLLRERLTPMGFDVVWVNVQAVLTDQWLKKATFGGIIVNLDMRDHAGMAVLERLHKQGVAIPGLSYLRDRKTSDWKKLCEKAPVTMS